MIGTRWGFYLGVPFAILILIAGLTPTAFGLGAQGEIGFLAYAAKSPFYSLSVLTSLGALVGVFVGFFADLIRRVFALPMRLAGLGHTTHLQPVPAPNEFVISETDLLDSTFLPPVRKRRPWFWILAVGLPAAASIPILAIAIGAGIYARKSTDQRLARAMAAADRDDPNWRIDALMARRKVVPDRENSAIRIARVNAMLPRAWHGTPPNPGRMNPDGTVEADAYGMLTRMEENIRLDDEAAGSIRDQLDRHRDALMIARSVADYPRGRHEIVLGPTLIDTLLDETQDSRLVARFLSVDAAIRAQDGDFDGAIDSCRAILNVGRSSGDEPFLISHLVRVALGDVAMQAARRVLGQGEPSDASLEKFQALVIDELHEPLYAMSMRAERATMDELIRRVADGQIPLSALTSEGDWVKPAGRRPPWEKLWLDNQRAISLEWMQAVVHATKQATHMRRPLLEAWEDEIARVRDSRVEHIAAFLPVLMIPALGGAEKAFSRYEARLGSMILLVASERHRRRTGDWPASIAAIDATILTEPPNDPYTGQPFRLIRDHGRFLIYSIGRNLRDEQGEFSTRGGPDDIGAVGWDGRMRGREE